MTNFLRMAAIISRPDLGLNRCKKCALGLLEIGEFVRLEKRKTIEYQIFNKYLFLSL